MGKTWQKKYIGAAFIVVYLVGVAIGLWLKYSSEAQADWVNDIITYVFFVVVLVVFYFAYSNLKKGDAFSKALTDTIDKINAFHAEGKSRNEILKRLLSIPELFEVRSLDTAFEEYRADVRQMEKVTSVSDVNIENYINQGLLEAEIQSHFLNQISGAMTGFGILGTFLGLSIGLNSFDLTGSASDITNEIGPLMNGIKVAFHTSIYGLIYSISFNFLYRRYLEAFRQSLTAFLNCFSQYVVPISENGEEGTLIRYQQKLCALAEQQINIFTSELSLAKEEKATEKAILDAMLGQQTLIGRMLQENNREINGRLGELLNGQNQLIADVHTGLTQRIAEVINASITPEIQKMGEAVEKFAEKAREDQKEGLEEIVDKFIELMNQSLGDSFAELGKVIEETNAWQKSSLVELQNVLAKIQSMAVDMAQLNQTIEKAADNVGAYTDLVDEMQQNVNAGIDNLNGIAEKNTEIIEKQADIITKINEQHECLMNKAEGLFESVEQRTANIEDGANKFVEKLSATVTDVSDHTLDTAELMGKIGVDIQEKTQAALAQTCEVNKAITEQMSVAAGGLSEAANNLNNGMEAKIKATFELFDNELSNIARHLAGTLEKMEKSLIKTEYVYSATSDTVTEKFEQLQSTMDQYLEYAYKLHHSLETKWQQMRDTEEQEG